VAKQLLSPEMFSGFGLRTLATSARAYNPVSYHNGSVWPPDNALCAAGLARYGFIDEAHRVIQAQLAVARSHHGRLPELFAGFDRADLAVPASYPTSCSPQAWAAAAPLLWLRTLLRLDPWASANKTWFDPHLPEGMSRLAVSGIRVGAQTLTVTVEGDHVSVDGSGGLEVVRAARPPLTSMLEPPI
jgi:glycogen debranching enzyme